MNDCSPAAYFFRRTRCGDSGAECLVTVPDEPVLKNFFHAGGKRPSYPQAGDGRNSTILASAPQMGLAHDRGVALRPQLFAADGAGIRSPD